MASLQYDDVWSLLHVLGCLLGSIFFTRKTLFSEHCISKIQLNYIIHASKWAQIGVKLVEFRRKSGVDDAGSLLWSFPNIKKFRKNSLFGPFLSSAPYKSCGGRNQILGVSYLEIYVELRDLSSGTFFSYFEVLCPNPLSDGPHRSIYPGFHTYAFSGKFTFWPPPPRIFSKSGDEKVRKKHIQNPNFPPW